MKLYTPLINKALKIAYDAHHRQVDDSGVPYIYHPAFLAAQMDTEDEIITALLHDVVEDTPVTFEALKGEGFPQAVLDALKLLTHNDKSKYMDYIRRIGSNPLAVKVKMADLRHNSDLSRNADLPPKKAARCKEKYGEAIRLLSEREKKWADLMQKAENSDPTSLFLTGAKYYWGEAAPLDKRKAFEMISRAMEVGLEKDVPGSYGEYTECKAAWFLADMLLKDDDGVLSARKEPFWFEKPLETASEVDKIFMYLTGHGGVERDLEKAGNIAHNIGYQFRYEHYADFHPAVELRDLIGRARVAEQLQSARDNPKEAFKLGVEYYQGRHGHESRPGSWNRQKAFEWFSYAMEKGLPKDEEYASSDDSELHAMLFLAPMLLTDEGGCLSTRKESFWFEKPLEAK